MQPRSAGFRTDIPGRSARWVGPERAGDRALAPPGRACPSSALMLSTSASTVSPAAIFRAGVAPSPARPRRREVRSREPITGTRSGGRRRAGGPVRSRRALPPRGKGTPAGTERCATDPDLAGVPGRASYQLLPTHRDGSVSAPGSRSALVDTCILREGGLHHAEIKTAMGAAVPAPDGRAGPNRTYAVDLAREFEPTARVRGPRGVALSDTYGQGRNRRCGRR